MGAHRAIYCRARSLQSLAIRMFDGVGPWSHVAGILYGDEWVIESLSNGGVQSTPLEDVIRRSSAFTIITREVDDKASGDVWALSTIGQRYDWGGVVGTPWHRNWQKPGRWFCSEHEAAWRAKCLTPAFRPDARGVGPNRSFWAL